MKAIQPTDDQSSAFLSRDQDAPVVMVNLLKFKDKATYAEGTAEYGEDVSGAEAYARYGAGVQKLLATIGAQPVYAGADPNQMIGEGEWDMVALVKYPSRKSMIEMFASEGYQAIHYHREAGLAYQDLIETTDISALAG